MVREIQSSGDRENTIRLPELSRIVKTAGVIRSSFIGSDGGSFRQCVKGVMWPIRECEWDTLGGFTKSGPGDSQRRFPDLPFLLVVTTRSSDASACTGKSEVDGSDPPFLPPGAGAGALRNSHLRNTPWGGGSLPFHRSLREGQT